MSLKRIAVTVLACATVVLLTTVPGSAQGLPCTQCPEGPHWVDDCGVPAGGEDNIANHGAVVGLDTDLDAECLPDQSFVLRPCQDTQLFVLRSAPMDVSLIWPSPIPIYGGGSADDHLDVIDTEIISACLTDGSVTMRIGAGSETPPQPELLPTEGAIVEDPADNTLANSFFEAYFEIELADGTLLYNHLADPLHVHAVINCVEPQGRYFHPVDICIPLYTDPVAGAHVANLVEADHGVNEDTVPSVSHWGLIVMALALLTAGAIVLGRRRRRAAA